MAGGMVLALAGALVLGLVAGFAGVLLLMFRLLRC